MNMSTAITRACQDVPGLIRAALVLLPEAYFLAGHGDRRAFDYEPLIRAAARCLAPRPTPAVDARAPAEFVEYALVFEHGMIIVEAGRRTPRLALALECDLTANLALVQHACRQALATLEADVDLDAWEMAS